MTLAAPAQALPRRGRHDHIVDVLIAERAPRLSSSPAWPLLRPLLYALLDYGKARRMADAIAPLPGRAALEHVSALLDVRLTTRGLERIPAAGRLVLVANHPTGIADGVALYEAVKGLRPDVCFYANADAHRVAPRFSEVLIPVEWVEAKRDRDRTRLTLRLTRQALEAERALAIFPAGRLARRAPDGRLVDPPWAASAISIARKYGAPIAPIHMTGPWSGLFHFFNGFSQELRDITLFHEMLNKQGRAFTVTVGPLIAPERLAGDAGALTGRLKAHVEGGLASDPDRVFA